MDISVYKKIIYTASDMSQIRNKLLLEEVENIVDRDLEEQLSEEDITVYISRDEMEACIEVTGKGHISKKDIMKHLKTSGITQGILSEEIDDILANKKFGQTIVIAKGKEPKCGADGYYEFLFDINPCRNPKILEDGSADYKDVKWFELVKKNQKLAYYHNAGFGVAGYTVTGKFLKARKGKEKNVLRGSGFRVENDGRTYTALIDGRVNYDGDSRLDVSRTCVLESVNLATGNISFDGTVYIKGDVGSGVQVVATEGIYVDGFVEAAVIKSGGEVLLRKGVNGSNGGIIEARQNVVGQFFEEVKVIPGAIYRHNIV